MTTGVLRRLMRADRQELRHRASAAARQARDRVRLKLRSPGWDRAAIGRVLSRDFQDQEGLRAAIAASDWTSIDTRLRRTFSEHRDRFIPGLQSRDETRRAIIDRFPAVVEEARDVAQPLLDGTIDVLGYQGLRIRDAEAGTIDWHLDPVHQRRPPFRFWATVPYLDPECGDHKIIWEINRHQHWLALGRAAWLTGDDRFASEIVRQLESWLPQNPPLVGVNWASMLELAFRAMSWLWAFEFCTALPELDASADQPWTVDLLVGVDAQLEHVRLNLSRYFSPNTHLLGEALALYVVGESLPCLANAKRWSEVGRQVLLDERTRQINPDGGHAELSPHYHRYALDFYLLALTIARVAADPAQAAFEQTARGLAKYMRAICDDRGRMPLIGDDDGGQTFPVCRREPWNAAPSLACAAALLNEPELAIDHLTEEAIWLAGPRSRISRVVPSPDAVDGAPQISTVVFPQTGYHVARTTRGDHLIFDTGMHGFLNGGHAHADALQVIFTSRGRPLLIDPGTSTYTMSPEVRDRFRATRMHNTMIVDGRDPSETAGPFHWRTRTDAHPWFAANAGGAAWFEGQHEGYAPLIHRRCVLLLEDGLFVVLDHLIGDDAPHDAVSFWHLSREWNAGPSSDGAVPITSADGESRCLVSTAEPGVFRGDSEGLGWCAPVYGQLEPTTTIATKTTGACPLTIATVISPGPARPRLSMRRIARETDLGTVLTITTGERTRQVISWTELNGTARANVDEWSIDGVTSCARVAAVDRTETEPVVLFATGGSELELAPSVHAEAP